jgi:hypothetical protein
MRHRERGRERRTMDVEHDALLSPGKTEEEQVHAGVRTFNPMLPLALVKRQRR